MEIYSGQFKSEHFPAFIARGDIDVELHDIHNKDNIEIESYETTAKVTYRGWYKRNQESVIQLDIVDGQTISTCEEVVTDLSNKKLTRRFSWLQRALKIGRKLKILGKKQKSVYETTTISEEEVKQESDDVDDEEKTLKDIDVVDKININQEEEMKSLAGTVHKGVLEFKIVSWCALDNIIHGTWSLSSPEDHGTFILNKNISLKI